MAALAICLLAGALSVTIPAHRFTLAWQHTVEKVTWEEDYVVAGDWLYLSGARIRGSGAGMEPSADAVWIDRAWSYRPAQRWSRQIALARSEFGADHLLCIERRCRPLTAWIARAPTTITPCGATPAR